MIKRIVLFEFLCLSALGQTVTESHRVTLHDSRIPDIEAVNYGDSRFAELGKGARFSRPADGVILRNNSTKTVAAFSVVFSKADGTGIRMLVDGIQVPFNGVKPGEVIKAEPGRMTAGTPDRDGLGSADVGLGYTPPINGGDLENIQVDMMLFSDGTFYGDTRVANELIALVDAGRGLYAQLKAAKDSDREGIVVPLEKCASDPLCAKDSGRPVEYWNAIRDVLASYRIHEQAYGAQWTVAAFSKSFAEYPKPNRAFLLPFNGKIISLIEPKSPIDGWYFHNFFASCHLASGQFYFVYNPWGSCDYQGMEESVAVGHGNGTQPGTFPIDPSIGVAAGYVAACQNVYQVMSDKAITNGVTYDKLENVSEIPYIGMAPRHYIRSRIYANSTNSWIEGDTATQMMIYGYIEPWGPFANTTMGGQSSQTRCVVTVPGEPPTVLDYLNTAANFWAGSTDAHVSYSPSFLVANFKLVHSCNQSGTPTLAQAQQTNSYVQANIPRMPATGSVNCSRTWRVASNQPQPTDGSICTGLDAAFVGGPRDASAPASLKMDTSASCGNPCLAAPHCDEDDLPCWCSNRGSWDPLGTNVEWCQQCVSNQGETDPRCEFRPWKDAFPNCCFDSPFPDGSQCFDNWLSDLTLVSNNAAVCGNGVFGPNGCIVSSTCPSGQIKGTDNQCYKTTGDNPIPNGPPSHPYTFVRCNPGYTAYGITCLPPQSMPPLTQLGIYRGSSRAVLEDTNFTNAFEQGQDAFISNFANNIGGMNSGDIMVAGDWTGDHHAKLGFYRPTTGQWFLDTIGTGNVNVTYNFGGLAGDKPFVGDWSGGGKDCIGIYRGNGSVWLLDLNCNGQFDNTPTDAFFPFGGIAGDIPVVGKWFGGATTKVGVVRKWVDPYGQPQGDPFFWVFDANPAYAGNDPSNHPAAPGAFAFGGLAGDKFVSGDWAFTGYWRAAVYRNGTWLLDYNGSHQYDAAHTFNFGGLAGDVPLPGRW